MTFTRRIDIPTLGNTHVIDLSAPVADGVSASNVQNGIVCVLVVGSTASVTTTEAEPGLLNYDLKAFFERIIPQAAEYKHQETWSDGNGHSHVRATLLGPSVCVPIVDGRLVLGTWQQIVLIDFDNRPRQRQIVIQVVGD